MTCSACSQASLWTKAWNRFSTRPLLNRIAPSYKYLLPHLSKHQLTRLSHQMAPKKVCIVGSGNWGSAIARLVGYNAMRFPEKFKTEVSMWVFEEEVNGRKLTEIINTDHENVKCLPGRKLPSNVVAEPDIVTAGADADYLIFVLPHQFIKKTCEPLQGKLK